LPGCSRRSARVPRPPRRRSTRAGRCPGSRTRSSSTAPAGTAGRHDRYLVGWFTPNRPAWTALALASTPQYRWLKPSYLPADPCCDGFSYEVTVRYQRGSTKVVRTMDGASAPKLLWQVIRLTQRGSAGNP